MTRDRHASGITSPSSAAATSGRGDAPGPEQGAGCWITDAAHMVPADLLAQRIQSGSTDWRHLLHVERTATGELRTLILTSQIDRFDFEEAHACYFSVRRWRCMSVGVMGSLKKRLADQQAIGRKRGPGERSPVPLPDWYDLTHVVYQHAEETGFDPKRDIWQFLPADHHEYVNYAEALHVRQPL